MRPWARGFDRIRSDLDHVLLNLNQIEAESEHIMQIAQALALSHTTEQLASVMADECKRALRADAVCFYLREENMLNLIVERGCTERFRKEWEHIPLALLYKLCDGEPNCDIYFRSSKNFKELIPELGEIVEQSGRESAAYAPLMVDSEPIGLFAFSFNQPMTTPFSENFLKTLISLCAQALDRGLLQQRETQARKEAENASRAKSDFLANMSHEIRTPLGVIKGFVELLAESRELSSEQTQWIDLINKNVLVLSNTIGTILDISKIEADKIEIETIAFSLAHLLEEVRAASAPRAAQKNLSLEFFFDHNDLTIHSDPMRLTQILTNLISNALKFTAVGGVKIVAQVLDSALEIMVSDTGIGIQPNNQSKIFEAFTQAEDSTERRFGGTGLGLTIARRLAQCLGGSLDLFSSQMNVGSTFRLTLPCKFDRPLKTIEVLNFKTDSLRGKSILLVEDSPDNQKLVTYFLSKVGAETEVANSGELGVKMALTRPYDLILMDIHMPELDGYEAVRQLRASGYKGPITALTACALQSEKDKAFACGFDAYLTKPIDRAVFLQTLSHLGQRDSETVIECQ